MTGGKRYPKTICKFCGGEFVANRITQKFCNKDHRQAFQKGLEFTGEIPALKDHPLDVEQARINREVDNRHAIQCDPARSIKGREFRELSAYYMEVETKKKRAAFYRICQK